MQKASKKRKASEKPSTFSFINEVEENPSLTIEQKINLIIKSLYKLKDVKGLSQCPRWIKSEQTKTLLSALDINPTDNFKFFDTEDQNQTEFKKAIYALVESFQEGDLETMSGLIKEKKEIFKIYKFKKTSDILMLVTAILGISDRINTYINNGEIRITGLYNSLFDLIFRMNSCIMKGDIIKQISFGEECPYFNVKCDSYAFNASSNVVFVREDKDSEEYDWEKIQTDGYKTMLVGRALLRENIRSYKMKEAELNRYSNFLGMTTNTQRIQCFLLECKYDQQFNPSYHLSKSEFTPTIMEGDHLDLVSLVEFMCRYARDKIPYKAEKVIGEEYVQVGLTPMKRVCDKIPLISKVLKSTVHESPLIIRGCAIKKQLHDNVWLVQSSSILKKTTKKEDFIYSKLLSGSLHCQHLPSVLRYNTDYVEIERLKEIDYKSDWEESELLALLQDMSCALKYLHTINIMHRDVKPNNILLREGEGDYFCYVLVDFDLSCNFEKRMENGQEYLFDLHQKTKINQDCGTSIFRAPEITLEQNYNEQVDIFSLGMTALYLYDPERMEKEYKEGKDWSNLLETSLIQHDLKSIIRRMIDLDPKQRPTATQLESELDNLVKGVSQILEEPEQESKPSSCMDDEIF